MLSPSPANPNSTLRMLSASQSETWKHFPLSRWAHLLRATFGTQRAKKVGTVLVLHCLEWAKIGQSTHQHWCVSTDQPHSHSCTCATETTDEKVYKLIGTPAPTSQSQGGKKNHSKPVLHMGGKNVPVHLSQQSWLLSLAQVLMHNPMHVHVPVQPQEQSMRNKRPCKPSIQVIGISVSAPTTVGLLPQTVTASSNTVFERKITSHALL